MEFDSATGYYFVAIGTGCYHAEIVAGVIPASTDSTISNNAPVRAVFDAFDNGVVNPHLT